MKTGFVVVNYNDYETTETIIKNIYDYKIIDEIVIVDNCSTDNSYLQLLKLNDKKVSIVRSDENRGYASGMNVGAKHLINKYKQCNIIFSNADIIIHKEEDIAYLIETLNKDMSYGIVAPTIEERTGLNRGWKVPTPWQDSVLNIACIHRYLRPKMLYYSEKYYTGLVPVGVVSGCFFCMRSDVLEQVGFFDENTFLYYEENIISKKLHMHGYKIMLQSDVSVFHNHSVTIDKSIHSVKKFKILKQSQIYFQKKYNKANWIQICLLYATNMMTLCVLYIANFFKKVIK